MSLKGSNFLPREPPPGVFYPGEALIGKRNWGGKKVTPRVKKTVEKRDF